MKNIFIISMIIVMFSCVSAEEKLLQSEYEGKSFHTSVNIWYDDGNVIKTTNYHVKEIIPVGTKVEIERVEGINIVFKISGTENSYTMVYIHEYTIPFEEYLKRMFVTSNVLESSNFTEQENFNINKGKIEPGMSKEAVLVAYGYPPDHKTPTLESNEWIYWITRTGMVTVTFENNVVVNVSF